MFFINGWLDKHYCIIKGQGIIVSRNCVLPSLVLSFRLTLINFVSWVRCLSYLMVDLSLMFNIRHNQQLVGLVLKESWVWNAFRHSDSIFNIGNDYLRDLGFHFSAKRLNIYQPIFLLNQMLLKSPFLLSSISQSVSLCYK